MKLVAFFLILPACILDPNCAAGWSAAPPIDEEYGVVATISGQGVDGIWDYATFDAKFDRLYWPKMGLPYLM
jgi:hypothetical protein